MLLKSNFILVCAFHVILARSEQNVCRRFMSKPQRKVFTVHNYAVVAFFITCTVFKENYQRFMNLFAFCLVFELQDLVDPLAPSDPYMGRTAQLTSRRCILNTYSTNIHTEYFKCAA
jgi:hypothetical protein